MSRNEEILEFVRQYEQHQQELLHKRGRGLFYTLTQFFVRDNVLVSKDSMRRSLHFKLNQDDLEVLYNKYKPISKQIEATQAESRIKELEKQNLNITQEINKLKSKINPY